MPEPIAAPVVEAPNPQAPIENAAPTENLVSRVSKFNVPDGQKPPVSEEVVFDYKEIDKITDPGQKAILEKAYKSMQSGWTKKFQEVADLRRSLESQASQKKIWTAEAIQKELLTDPLFVAEAQRISAANPNPGNPSNSGMTEQEWSALTPTEKAKFQMLEGKISALEQQNSQAVLQQQHQTLKAKYANYASDFVDTTVKEVMQGTKQITLEDVWKATDYESAVQRAYELGKSDALGKVKEKVQSSSLDLGGAGQLVPSGNPVETVKGESGLSFFKRIARSRLAQSNGHATVR